MSTSCWCSSAASTNTGRCAARWNRSVKVDVRIISATHRNLAERIKTGGFREDLYYRINVIEIQLPALRDRPGDLPLLLRHFIQKFLPAGAPVPNVSPAAWAALVQYGFPGNIRELSHAVEHALVLSGGKEIDLQHLPPTMADGAGTGPLVGAGDLFLRLHLAAMAGADAPAAELLPQRLARD